MVIVDASVLAEALVDESPRARRARAAILHRGELVAPRHIDSEVLAALRKFERNAIISPASAARAVADLARIDLVRAPSEPVLQRVWELRDNLSPYDAMYVATAERLHAPLVTYDGRLARAPGPRCDIELLE